jgi:alkanesulfonate monooxygenase SsuD/methylene tetrahydromethanopterin reductase-like flavin-dependent oxidoreductase (luciferase family)
MNLGFFTMPVHPLDKDWRQCLAEDREAFILADELGFTEAYVGEHVTDQAENITSCMVFLATLVNDVKRMRLGTGTVNLPNSHPAAVAGNIAMLDHLLDGRLNFGISPGGLLSDAEVFGNLAKDRTEMFVEAIDMVLAIWAGAPPYSLNGKHWQISTGNTMLPDIGQGIIPRPLQQPYPPIVVTAVAPYSKGVIAAAERGWQMISANFLLPKWVATHWPQYCKGCDIAGRTADLASWRVAKSVCVADDLRTAREYALGADSPYRFYFNQIVTKMKYSGRANLFLENPGDSADDLSVDEVLDKLVIWGTPDKVADELMAFREQTGAFGTLLYAGKDWADRELSRRSMILMAEAVLPRLA